MARKSKKTLLIEGLSEICECPSSVLELYEDIPDLFSIIKASENGDVLSLERIMGAIYQCDKCDMLFDAMEYFGRIAINLSAPCPINYLIKYSLKTNCLFALALQGYTALLKSDSQSLLELDPNTLSRLNALRVIDAYTAGSAVDGDIDLALFEEGMLPEKIFALSHEARYDLLAKSQLSALVSEKAPHLLSLGTVMGECVQNQHLCDAALPHMLSYLEKYDIIAWKEFWLRAIYEYSEITKCGFSPELCKAIIKVIYSRRHCELNDRFALGWISLALKNNNLTDKDKDELSRLYKSTLAECKFSATEFFTDDDAELTSVIRESVYTRDRDCKALAEKRLELGLEILHVKNRFTLVSRLSNHIKRAKNHCWDIKLCIDKSVSDTPPVFLPLRLDRVYHRISRGGITKESDPKKVSQIILSSELLLDDVHYPFNLDLIVDMAYVCSAKCQNAEIKVRDIKEYDGYFVLNCTLYLN